MNEEIEKIKEEIMELLSNKRYSNLNKYMEQIRRNFSPKKFPHLQKTLKKEKAASQPFQ